MLAIINPQAGGGRALEKWRRIESRVRASAGDLETQVCASPAESKDLVIRSLSRGQRQFLACGGDGTVNTVLECILENALPSELPEFSLGAVGLGSSNDFHKPYRDVIRRVPCRIEFKAAFPHDIGILTYDDLEGTTKTRYWLVNASIGTTAEANHLFNEPDAALQILKKTSTSSGILYAAVKTILKTRGQEMIWKTDETRPTHGFTRNIGIVKNPNFAGSMHYDSPYEPDSGSFFIHHVGGVSGLRFALILAGLVRGQFSRQRGTRSWRAHRFSIRNGGPFAIEFDGEVVVARKATFALIPRMMRICP